MGIKFRTKEARDAYRRHLEAPPSILPGVKFRLTRRCGSAYIYDEVANWHSAGLPKPEGTPIEILARYLPKEKRWLVLVDSENPFVTEHASLAEAMRMAGAMADPSGN